MLPALRTTSLAACAVSSSRPFHTSTPVQRGGWLPSAGSNSRRVTWLFVHKVKLGRRTQVGRRKALAAFQRQPAFWFTSK